MNDRSKNRNTTLGQTHRKTGERNLKGRERILQRKLRRGTSDAHEQ